MVKYELDSLLNRQIYRSRTHIHKGKAKILKQHNLFLFVERTPWMVAGTIFLNTPISRTDVMDEKQSKQFIMTLPSYPSLSTSWTEGGSNML